DEVFRRGQHRVGVGEIAGLETANQRRGEQLGELLCLTESLVRATPPFVTSSGDDGSEGPIDLGGAHFPCRDAPDAFNEVRVTSGAQTDVVGKNYRAVDVVVAVDGVDAVDDGNRRWAAQRSNP